MIEALILTICLQGQGGCTQSLEAYYKSHPELDVIVKRVEKKAKDLAGERVVAAVLPMAAFMVSNEASFRLNSYWAIRLNKNNDIGISFNWKY